MIRIFFCLFLCISIAGFSQAPLSTKSKKAIELYTEADNYRVRGQFESAITLLKQAIDKDENFVEAYYRMGIVYMNMRQYAKAIEYFENGLKRTTDLRSQKTFWYEMGEAYLLVGEYEKAMKVLSAFVNNESQNKAKINRATTLFRSAEFAFKNKDNASGFKQRPLSDTVNCFGTQYFPVLTADEQQLIFTRRLSEDPNADEDLVISYKDKNGRWAS